MIFLANQSSWVLEDYLICGPRYLPLVFAKAAPMEKTQPNNQPNKQKTPHSLGPSYLHLLISQPDMSLARNHVA